MRGIFLLIGICILVFLYLWNTRKQILLPVSRRLQPNFPVNVLVCGIGHNVAHAIPGLKRGLMNTLKHFHDYRMFWYENDSTDDTRELMNEWAAEDSRVRILSEVKDRGSAIDARPDGEFLGDFTSYLADYRNMYLDELQKPIYRDFQYVWILDMDLEHGFPKEPILELMAKRDEWDMVAANGLMGGYSYDSLAFRDAVFPDGPPEMGEAKYWHWPDVAQRKGYMHNVREEWHPVISAFGGMAMYKRKSITGCRYQGKVGGVPECEHVPFNRCVRGKKFVYRNWTPVKGSHGYHA